ncbi:MAG: rhodanese-like domain-containing protein [Desulfobacter sp.]|nr:rhodanese-like domain-containing protein [Desulfobacter sp.]
MKKISLIVLTCLLAFGTSAFGGYRYQIKVDHEGGNVTPSQAYEMVKRDPAHTFIIDTRTRAEHQFVGHPVGAYNIPLIFWNGQLGEKGYGLTTNSGFSNDLLERFNPATDKLIFMCRSGKRSCLGCTAAIKAGWNPKDICNMLGGFEGDKIENKTSIYNGQRKLGGWKNEGLPWTYHVDNKLVYKADFDKANLAQQ